MYRAEKNGSFIFPERFGYNRLRRIVTKMDPPERPEVTAIVEVGKFRDNGHFQSFIRI